jgi:ABC-type uncharacterized transport system permease subunit
MSAIFLFVFVFLIATFSALVSTLYLIDEYLLKVRRGAGLRFVSLKFLDSSAFVLAALALFVLTVALVWDGFKVFSQLDFRNLTTLLIWAYFAVYLILKALLNWRGRSLAYYVLLGYGLMCLNVGYCLWPF